MLQKTGIEFHWPGYQYTGPGMYLKKRLKRRDPGINRLDKTVKQHDIDYSQAKNLQDKWKADAKMVKAISNLTSKKTWTEAIVKRIMQAKQIVKDLNGRLTLLLQTLKSKVLDFHVSSLYLPKCSSTTYLSPNNSFWP